MNTEFQLVWSVILGAIGFGYFIYSKKHKAVVPFCSAIGLFILPYLVNSLGLLIIIALILMVLPYWLKY
ncbi:hypothetical protein [Oceanicoccus sp. KOV_DT_Chl]|uniref:hypothetical protein n=1 Tax=Oceanicoccus sp. KOV_DT_Chl TaxID=1904639 RepID=UPI000C7B30CA|nr:hypothetical protein [Oceanicoccus sp. KOV_DT_Chl]